jgi:hypothetical protein
LPQALQAWFISAGTFLGIQPKLLRRRDNVVEELYVPRWQARPRSSDSWTVFFCIRQDLLAAMWCQKPMSRNLCDVLARSLEDELTLRIWC